MAMKLFVGGLPQVTTKETLNDYFGQFGGSPDSYVMMDSTTGNSRGFGFVNFHDAEAFQLVLEHPVHEVDGARITVREYTQQAPNKAGAGGPPAIKPGYTPSAASHAGGANAQMQGIVGQLVQQVAAGGSNGGGGNGYGSNGVQGGSHPADSLKIFVGGLADETTKETLDAYFGQYGVVDSYIMRDGASGRSRGFGFVNFKDQATMEAVLGHVHEVDGRQLNVDYHGGKGAKKQGPRPISGGGAAAAGGGLEALAPLLEAAVSGSGGGGSRQHPADAMKIFVGGLADETTKETLDAYFGQFGPADSYIMRDGASGRSRGFGFVNFKDHATMEAVLSSMHEVDGRHLKVDYHGGSGSNKQGAPAGAQALQALAPLLGALDQGGSGCSGSYGGGGRRDHPADVLKIYVGGLADETTKETLDSYFGQFGAADSYIMRDGASGRSRGFGFVNFKDPSVLEMVLSQAHVVDGRHLNVDRHGGTGSNKQGGGGGGGSTQQPLQALAPLLAAVQGGCSGSYSGSSRSHPADACKIFVGGLADETTKETLDAYFSQFGTADSYVMRDGASGRSRGFGFVNFKDQATMDMVLATAHEVDGRRLKVDSHGGNGSKSQGGYRGIPGGGSQGSGGVDPSIIEALNNLSGMLGKLTRSTPY